MTVPRNEIAASTNVHSFSSITHTRVRRGSLASIASVLSKGLLECEEDLEYNEPSPLQKIGNGGYIERIVKSHETGSTNVPPFSVPPTRKRRG